MQACALLHAHTMHTNNTYRPNISHMPIPPMCIHSYMHTHTRDWAFLSLAKPQTAENQAKVERSNPEKGGGDEGHENEVYVGGGRKRGAREPSAKEKNQDHLKEGKPSDRAGMQAVIRITSTVSRLKDDRQTGCTCSMVIPSLDSAWESMLVCAWACMHTWEPTKAAENILDHTALDLWEGDLCCSLTCPCSHLLSGWTPHLV